MAVGRVRRVRDMSYNISCLPLRFLVYSFLPSRHYCIACCKIAAADTSVVQGGWGKHWTLWHGRTAAGAAGCLENGAASEVQGRAHHFHSTSLCAPRLEAGLPLRAADSPNGHPASACSSGLKCARRQVQGEATVRWAAVMRLLHTQALLALLLAIQCPRSCLPKRSTSAALPQNPSPCACCSPTARRQPSQAREAFAAGMLPLHKLQDGRTSAAAQQAGGSAGLAPRCVSKAGGKLRGPRRPSSA